MEEWLCSRIRGLRRRMIETSSSSCKAICVAETHLLSPTRLDAGSTPASLFLRASILWSSDLPTDNCLSGLFRLFEGR